MDDKKLPKRKEFPKEFEYLDELISKPIQQIHSLEKRLTELPDKPVEKSNYEYNPPGYFRAKLLAAAALSKDNIERYIDTLEKDVTDLFEVQIKGLDADDANKLREIFQDRRHPNPYEDMNKEQLDAANKKEKDINHSQHFMLRKKQDHKEYAANMPKTPLPEPTQKPTPSDIFNHSLSSTFQKNTNEFTEKYLGKSKDIDDPEIT